MIEPTCGAGLGVGAVARQLPVGAERLVLVMRALSAGHIRATLDRAVPLTAQRVEQAVVGELDRDVRRPGREVVGAHGMPAQCHGVAHGNVVLEVLLAPLDLGERPVPVPLDEQGGLIDVALLAECASEFREADLDLGVAADRIAPVGAEHAADEVRGASGDRDEPVVGIRSRAVPGDRRLEQMPEAVQLVPPLQIRPAVALAQAAEHRVHVAVGLLRGSDARHDRPEPLLERGVCRGIRPSDLPGERLEVLVDLGVGELPAAAPGGKRRRRQRDRSSAASPPTRGAIRCDRASPCR